MSSFTFSTSRKTLLDITPDFCIKSMKFITVYTKVRISLGEERPDWSLLQTFFCAVLCITDTLLPETKPPSSSHPFTKMRDYLQSELH